MVNRKTDKDTNKILSENERVLSFVESADWHLIRKKIIDKIMDLQSIRNIPDNANPQVIVIDLKARLLAVDILFNFLREVEGTAEIAKNPPIQKIEGEYILQFGEYEV